MKNEDKNSNENINNILKKEKKQTLNTPAKELKKFQDEKLDKYFDKLETPKEKFEEDTEELKKVHIDEEEIKPKIKEIKKQDEKKKETKKEEVKKVTITKSKKDLYTYDKKTKPKLAIILDDISSSKQKKAILNIGYNVTMAFLPPQEGHLNSAKIAQDVPVHMIHFPMQASSKFKSKEKTTLNINDSYEKIEGIVKKLRQQYPKAKYTNNHTGSVFTQNDAAMDKLFRALKKYNFVFVDSRTTAKSVAKKYAKKYGMPYIVRNTFLDNERNFQYIQNQLKKAIKIAKKRGYAIAIGHPYSITIQVLKESKHLLKDVEPIFINKLPYL
ncbi:divergent polysaccharide deacetylase family protein [Poseidonibacter lekithochrous]|uniref:divergent polysaccharide deacetylase family protein n=1 Tax=Poseidonibacter TaxID=2321187 RepID=UPI001C08E16B|nr:MULTISPECIES: divergent polysaccharide deacetylase family protein [Poseidonibacter]MBU3013353.1 divergent polysaccharide deacetylase family protein [Poseidonibacter lekithochrous]MDO6826650.1 divergent polysaccharide deacetylase family protein [Poseidonibacter sp. 1_MG-2023]